MSRSNLAVVSEDALQSRPVGFYPTVGKRVLDVIGGLLLLVLILPAVAAIALAVRLRLGPGVFYSQKRVGREGETFTIWKFRTMLPDRRRQAAGGVSHDRRKSHKDIDDPRHTRLGRLLRRFSLDELPQLWNVIRGDMSLVGPRPELRDVAAERGYLHHVRHQVRPGMTGPYQTSDLRLNGDLRDGLKADADYVASISLGGDLMYLLRTVSTMVGGSARGV